MASPPPCQVVPRQMLKLDALRLLMWSDCSVALGMINATVNFGRALDTPKPCTLTSVVAPTWVPWPMHLATLLARYWVVSVTPSSVEPPGTIRP